MRQFKAQIRRKDLEGNPDAWWTVCFANTREAAHDEAIRQIAVMNWGRIDPTFYHVHVMEVTE